MSDDDPSRTDGGYDVPDESQRAVRNYKRQSVEASRFRLTTGAIGMVGSVLALVLVFGGYTDAAIGAGVLLGIYLLLAEVAARLLF